MNAAKDENADHDSIENQSEASDSTTAKSVESLSRSTFGKDTRYSFDSMDDSVGRQSISSQSDRNGFGRQDSIESNESSSYGSYSTTLGSVRSFRSLQSHGRNQRKEFRKSCQEAATLLQPVLKEGGDDATVQELEAEARMWEQNARKLGVDMERLRDELSDQNLSMTKLNMELAASRLECQELTQEIEHVKSLLDESERKQNAAQEMEFQELGHGNVQKELEEEIRFQKEENENLYSQLNKTQESNIELISILQEMEETIEKQKIEIESLLSKKPSVESDHVSLKESKSANSSDLDAAISEVSTADFHGEIPRENSCISELQGALQCEVLILESAFQERMMEIEIEEDVKRRVVKEFVVGCNRVLAEREQQIMNLEDAALSTSDGRRDIKQLKEKVHGLEEDCNELREENLELVYELKYRMNVPKSSNCHHSSELGQHELCIEQPMIEEGEKTEILQEEIADFEDLESIGKDGIFVSECSSKSGDKIDEMRLMGAENNQTELMKLLSDMQGENIYLLQRVAATTLDSYYLIP